MKVSVYSYLGFSRLCFSLRNHLVSPQKSCLLFSPQKRQSKTRTDRKDKDTTEKTSKTRAGRKDKQDKDRQKRQARQGDRQKKTRADRKYKSVLVLPCLFCLSMSCLSFLSCDVSLSRFYYLRAVEDVKSRFLQNGEA